MFGDVNVKVEDGNLGRSSSTGTGTSIKIGISNVESKSPILISGTMNAKKIKEKVGNTPLADACIDAVEWGASSIYCIPVKAGTAGTIGKITEDKKGYGTFEVKGSPNNAYDIVVEVMDAGECNEGSFRYSLDGGNTFTEEMTIPITGEAELATTGLTAKFTDAEGGDRKRDGCDRKPWKAFPVSKERYRACEDRNLGNEYSLSCFPYNVGDSRNSGSSSRLCSPME